LLRDASSTESTYKSDLSELFDLVWQRILHSAEKLSRPKKTLRELSSLQPTHDTLRMLK